jgi:hypothetical protein
MVLAWRPQKRVLKDIFFVNLKRCWVRFPVNHISDRIKFIDILEETEVLRRMRKGEIRYQQ